MWLAGLSSRQIRQDKFRNQDKYLKSAHHLATRATRAAVFNLAPSQRKIYAGLAASDYEVGLSQGCKDRGDGAVVTLQLIKLAHSLCSATHGPVCPFCESSGSLPICAICRVERYSLVAASDYIATGAQNHIHTES